MLLHSKYIFDSNNIMPHGVGDVAKYSFYCVSYLFKKALNRLIIIKHVSTRVGYI